MDRELKALSRNVKRSIEEDLEEAEEIVLTERRDPLRYFFLRPSGFPFCGLQKLVEAPDYFGRDTRDVTLGSSYFTGVGTSAHATFQAFLGATGRVVGNWKCTNCNRVREFKTFKMCSCGGTPKYEELEITYKNTILGHTDGLYRLKNKKTGKTSYYVIDYKTTAKYKIPQAHRHFPIRSNVLQIEAYSYLLEKQFGITIEGWALIYLGRDLPLGKNGRHIEVKALSKDDKSRIKRTVNAAVRLHRQALVAKSKADVRAIMKEKLCKSELDYNKNWKDPYNPCPFESHCFTKRAEAKAFELLKQKGVFPVIQHATKSVKKRLDLL